MRTLLRTSIAVVTLLSVGEAVNAAEDAPSFQREVRPILSEHCFRCHGFDENARQARLRLDDFEGATRPAESGTTAIVPFMPDKSELLRRITSDDPEARMPPPEHGKALSAVQSETLRRWIANGAKYSKHWAFEQPRRSRRAVRDDEISWPRKVIDLFVLDRLKPSGIRTREAADFGRLLRRVSLDLTGLPPTPEELDHFQDAVARDPDVAYEAEVDRLLNSPHFGERLAIDWMDAARFADTNGYFEDKPRQAWPWRDWVINAFNDNMPFDQFTIEQLAGDLLPNATRDQRIATGFHRNSMTNNETGIIDEEYRVEAIADRVETTSTVWLGMTIACAQCHDHKYDPISQREYYQLFAYFNQSVETGLVTKQDPPPTLEVPTIAQAAALLRTREERESAEKEFQSRSKSLDADISAWELIAPQQLPVISDDAVVACDFEHIAGRVIGTTLQRERGIRGDAAKFEGSQHVELDSDFDADRAWTISVWVKPTGSLGCVCSKIDPADERRGVEMIWQKGRLQIHLVHRWGVDEIAATTRDPMSSNEWHHLLVSYDGTRKASGLRVILDGRHSPLNVQRDTLTGSMKSGQPLRIGRRDSGLGYYGLLDEFRILPRVVSDQESTGWFRSERLRGIFAWPVDRPAAESLFLREHFIANHAAIEVRDAYQRLQQARRAESAARVAIPTALVMQDAEQPRKTNLLIRGQYDKPGVEVHPGVPAILPQLPSDAPRNRLALARWLVSRDNPLTARVAVNRMWQMCFGEGLVRTPNDFGTQGEMPTHPELLDELAVRFVESGWDVKSLLRLIVTSATYRQSSQATAEQLQRDPENRLLARGPRFRLTAELIRDQALFASGLFVARIGGPSVKPYQPEGLWEEVSYNEEETYVVDVDEGLWRRSLYSFWKRQVPPPSLLTLDANTREKCIVRRSRTNTPLQALVLLNDETYVAAARNLATLILRGRGDDNSRLRSMFRRVVSRWPEPSELQTLANLLARQRQIDIRAGERGGVSPPVRKDENSVGTTGGLTPPRSPEARELAAWTLVAQTILNLDEVITRR